MAAPPDHNALLDQLQAQVNVVLESTGRVFAAHNTDPKTAPNAQINKLKHIVPVAQNRFHEALDQLETELHLAQLVMRRDLALCRERAGQSSSAAVQPQQVTNLASSAAHTFAPTFEVSAAATSVEESAAAPVAADQDISMEDPVSAEKADQPFSASPDTQMNDTALAADSDFQLTASVSDVNTAETSAKEKPSSPPKAPAPVVNMAAGNSLPPETNQLESSRAETLGENEKAPDTSQESNTGDLESLFGGGTDNNDFTFDQTNASEIDFGDFGTNFNTDNDNGDNDNISSLLPGLEDYANTQPNGNGGELDLNSFFVNGDAQGVSMNQQGNGEQRDTTFDDLMDLGNFDTTGMEDGNNNATTDFQFESLFE